MVATYTFGDAIWSIFIFFLWVLWFWLLFAVFGDLFRRHDIGGGAKTLWTIFVLIVPFLGTFIYLIAEGKGMGERQLKGAQASQAQMDSYVRTVAGSSNAADQIAKAKELLDNGTLTQAEFDQVKAKALAG